MQTKKSKRLFHVTLIFDNNLMRTVKVRAVTREQAEKRAMKFHPSARGVKHDA